MTRRPAWTVALFTCAAIAGIGNAAYAQPKPALKIGVTLHPYFSWTRNVVGHRNM